jgi:phosphatidylserine decarboxylase
LITKYGYDVVGVVLVLVVAGSALSWFFLDARLLKFAVIGGLFVVLVFTLNFFRDPDRTPPPGENLLLAPADGTVVLVQDVTEDEYIKGEAVQISIFMSPFNVHVNRYPLSGTVGHFRHFSGEFLVAFDDKASLRNERTHIGIENGQNRVLFKQIAGFVARRIVADVRVGDVAVRGERFGMIKFGSRMDVLMPRKAAVQVKIGDRTVAGETVLAVLS